MHVTRTLVLFEWDSDGRKGKKILVTKSQLQKGTSNIIFRLSERKSAADVKTVRMCCV